MYTFHKGLYTDVRIETVFETRMTYAGETLEESKVRKYRGAFIRVFDGKLWYYASTSNLDSIQAEIDKLSKMANPNKAINSNPIVLSFEVNKGQYLKFKDNSVTNIPREEKVKLLKSLFPIVQARETIKFWKANYVDAKKTLEIYSSKGTQLEFDVQRVGLSIAMNLAEGDNKFSDHFQRAGIVFSDISDCAAELSQFIDKCEDYLRNAQPITPGKYPVILSPLTAGVFAHESFGHKSESDFMVGDETMKREWAIGTRVGSEILSIADDGTIPGSGYTPFDDEGTKSRTNYLIKDGILAGRLHSASTAAQLEEGFTGNARSINFEYEPIVRMTTTYILPGSQTKEELFSEIQDGFYIETIKHGSGLSMFTIAPSLAYRIRNGKIAEPVMISVISGTVFGTLSEIDGLSNKLELYSFVMGGCGKMEQFPLPVGFGGPYVRVKSMNVQ